MDYSLAMFVTSVLLAFPMLLLSAFPFFGLRRLRAIPSGGEAAPAYLLLVCTGYAILFLYTSVDMLVVQPARLQQRYLGRVEAGPLSLRSYFRDGFFKDPGDSWVYALRPDTAARLQRHCRPIPLSSWEKASGIISCSLLSREDEHTYTNIHIDNGRLHLDDGLH